MKKLSIILVLVTSIFLTGCKSAPGGPYAIPVALYVIAAICFAASYFSSKSKSTQQVSGVGIVEGGNVKYFQTWPWKYGVGILAFAILSNIWIYGDYRLYDPKKHGVGKEAPKDNRESAEDLVKKADSVYNLKK
jgi:hypothetical protein